MPNYDYYKKLAESTNAEDPQVDNNLRKAWNDYTLWLEKKGLKGHPDLDKNNKSFEILEQYRKENPSTPLTKEIIPVIQKDFQNYRQWVLDKTKLPKGTPGRVELSAGVNEDNFMKDLSIVDGIAGQRTTSFSYPSAFLDTREQGQIIARENQGFSVAKNK